jgi:hypothetical protein
VIIDRSASVQALWLQCCNVMSCVELYFCLSAGGGWESQCAQSMNVHAQPTTTLGPVCLFVFISSTMRSSGHGLGASSPLITTPQYQR